MVDSVHTTALRALAEQWSTGPVRGTYEARICEIVRGLVDAVELDPALVGPLAKDAECVPEAIASAASSVDGDH